MDALGVFSYVSLFISRLQLFDEVAMVPKHADTTSYTSIGILHIDPVFPSCCVPQLQLFDEVAMVRDGRVLHVLSASGSRGVFPSVMAVSPRFVAADDSPLVALTGANIAGEDAAVLARSGGEFLLHVGCIAGPTGLDRP